jgi:membrane protease subunit (stomatin/prohibitin family)
MSIWDKLKGELIDIIEWLDDTNNTVVYRFDRYNNEIKYGAKLVVREGQVAAFVNEGQLADVFSPGTHTLQTQNLPILATLKGWKYGFNSPFKAEVYFVSTRQFTDLKWGTMNPVMMRDPEFGPVRIRAFGTYTMRVKDAGAFIKNVSGTDNRFTTEEIVNQLRNLIVAQLPVALGELKMPVLDLAAQQANAGEMIARVMRPEFEKLGLELPKLLIENISLPPEVEAAMDRRTSMGVVGDLNKYTQFQAAESLKAAAENPSGTAGAGMGMGMGFAMAQQMGQAMMGGSAAPSTAGAGSRPAGGGGGGPPPLPGASGAVAFFVAINNQQAGPFDLATVAGYAKAGQLTRDTLVWREGMAAWAKAGEVAELAGAFASVPPPLPPR